MYNPNDQTDLSKKHCNCNKKKEKERWNVNQFF